MCLLVALPQSADAWLFGPSTRDQTESVEKTGVQEVSLWFRIWSQIGSFWTRTSVMIIPEGGEESGEGEGDGDQGNGNGNGSNNGGS